MIKKATKGIILITILVFPPFTDAQKHSNISHLLHQPIITQDDLIEHVKLQDQGLMNAKELIEFDRILIKIKTNPQKMDYRSVSLLDLSRTNRNLK